MKRASFKFGFFIFSILIFNYSFSQLIAEEYWLDSVEVRTIHYSTKYGLIVGSGDGILLYDTTKKQFLGYAFSDRFPVSYLYEDSKNNLWIGGLGYLRMVNETQAKTYSINEDIGLEGRVIFSISQDNNQNIWTSAPGGAAVYKEGTWQTYTEADGLKHKVVHDVCQASDNSFWFATRKGGLNILSTEWQYELPGKNTRKLFKDRSGSVWVGTSEGLFIKSKEGWKGFEEGYVVLPMFQDKDKNVWCIRSATDLITVSDQWIVTTYTNPLKSQVTEIYDMCVDDSGRIWLATDNGVYGIQIQY